MVAEKSAKKQRGEPFKPGQSGNPAGKPQGTRNKTTMAAQAFLDGEAEALTRKAVELALEGNPVALKLCLERLLPPRRERPVTMDLPPVKTAADIPCLVNKILELVGQGDLTPSEASTLTSIVEIMRKGLEMGEIAERLTILERKLK